MINRKHAIDEYCTLCKYNTESDHKIVKCEIFSFTKVERMKFQRVNHITSSENNEKFPLELKKCLGLLKSILEEEQKYLQAAMSKDNHLFGPDLTKSSNLEKRYLKRKAWIAYIFHRCFRK